MSNTVRNPYVEVCRKYFKGSTVPDKKKKANKNACRKKVKYGSYR